MTRCQYCNQALTQTVHGWWIDDSGTVTCHGGSPTRRHEPEETSDEG